MGQDDPRRQIPRTDQLLAHPEVRDARSRLGDDVIRSTVRAVQEQARRGDLAPADVEAMVLAAVAYRTATSFGRYSTPPASSSTRIWDALRSPAPPGQALLAAAGYVDVEMDLATGARSRRGAGARQALLDACPAAEEALVVNNGAAALVLATTALAGAGEVVISRGELVEIGAGFRLPELIESTGARLREVGTTNRTHLADYAAAIGTQTGCLLKVHPSNFRVDGFTSDCPDRTDAPADRSPTGYPWLRTWAAACSHRTRCCLRSRTSPPRWPLEPTSSSPAGTSSWAARKPDWPWAVPK